MVEDTRLVCDYCGKEYQHPSRLKGLCIKCYQFVPKTEKKWQERERKEIEKSK
jgi:hypothetical protein